MRLVGSMRLGKFRLGCMPLDICPGRQVWERHPDQQYAVFVDKSSYRFFGFDASDGNFCHAALGIPIDNYVRLQAMFAATVPASNRQARRAVDQNRRELKFSVLRNLTLSFRLRLARGLGRCLAETGRFAAGYYSSTSDA